MQTPSTEKETILLFTSPTCGPCRVVKPRVHQFIDQHENEYQLVEVDATSENKAEQSLLEAYNVNSVPTVLVIGGDDSEVRFAQSGLEAYRGLTSYHNGKNPVSA